MTPDERMMELAKLRFRLHTNGRLRLELLAAISRILREYQEPIKDEVLSSLVFAAPEELMGEAAGSSKEATSRGLWNPSPHPIPPAPTAECDSDDTPNPPPHPIPPRACDPDFEKSPGSAVSVAKRQRPAVAASLKKASGKGSKE
jgi:hypothetical protein